jgi:hypothetical protein
MNEHLRNVLNALAWNAQKMGYQLGEIAMNSNTLKLDGVKAVQLRPLANGEYDDDAQPPLGILQIHAPGDENLLELHATPSLKSNALEFNLTNDEIALLKKLEKQGLVSLYYLESIGLLNRSGRKWKYSQTVVQGEMIGAEEIFLETLSETQQVPWVRISGYANIKKIEACWLHRLPGSGFYLPILRSGWLPIGMLEDPFRPRTLG